MATIPQVKVGSTQKPMPVIGMGTSSDPPVELEIAKTAILEAIKAGYRHFDTAFAYGSEMSLGVAIAEALRLGLIKSRDELFITTKLFASFASRDQVEVNPLWQQKKLIEFCKEKGIHVTAYSPLGANGTKWGDNRIVESDVLGDIAKAKGKTTAQVSLRWVYEQGVSLVTKSYNKERMKENLEIFDFSLTEEELNKISQLPQRKGVTFASLLGPHELVLEVDAEI
ncbi:hypothetical protein RJ639_034146 [Escallonia herrerae]|uniref:NADP-dependent oxidoreductase domain-containing protein n=1 Tax=Escallonia herrerae TaxID=1293975 RepID=A0AA89B9E5_9ASTE|nr:hypothetical protein RJ639_034146 [Escallonia herrerae]